MGRSASDTPTRGLTHHSPQAHGKGQWALRQERAPLRASTGNTTDEDEIFDPTDYVVFPLQFAIGYCERARKYVS